MSTQHLSLVLLFSLVCHESVAEKPGNFTLGKREKGDHLLERFHVYEPYCFRKELKMIKTFACDGHSIITFIKAVELNPEGGAGRASVIHGGLDTVFVTMKFLSKKGYDLNFLVEIYGMDD